MRLWYLAIGLLLLGALMGAQAPTNPTTIEFAHAFYAVVDRYVLGYFASADAPAPVQEADFPKPASCAPCAGPLVSRPTAFQTWYVGVRAVAGTTSSVWSDRVPFLRAPLAPSRVVLK